MIVKVNHPAGDHYHICDGCGLESAPDECIDPADECVDIDCVECPKVHPDYPFTPRKDVKHGFKDCQAAFEHVYQCTKCKQVVCECFGAADEDFPICDDCWEAKYKV